VSVNLGRFLKINEHFVLANKASQVFYGNDNSSKGWEVVMKTQPRDSFEIIEQMNDDIVELGSPSQKKRKRINEVKYLFLWIDIFIVTLYESMIYFVTTLSDIFRYYFLLLDFFACSRWN